MPILNIALNRMLFEEALPEPFSVATQIFRSLIAGVSKIQPPLGVRQLYQCNIKACKDNVLASHPGVYWSSDSQKRATSFQVRRTDSSISKAAA